MNKTVEEIEKKTEYLKKPYDLRYWKKTPNEREESQLNARGKKCLERDLKSIMEKAFNEIVEQEVS